MSVIPAKDEYVNLIRETHRNLRRKLTDGNDFAEVWKRHCADDCLLQDYSRAMQQLATSVWDGGCDGRDRTKWCADVSLDYYCRGGMLRLLQKDERRKQHYEKEKTNFLRNLPDESDSKNNVAANNEISHSELRKLKLLDVGSCFNPFASLSEFDTTAIDLSPANQTVHKCDFLSVDIDHAKPNSIEKFSEICAASKFLSTLPADYFEVVVFSLLLSYIPCPHSRWLMCKKAYSVLVSNGLLLIITPDSSHQNRHARLMKKWRVAIETIGFQRIKYEKDKHFHFIAFRKLPVDFIWDKRKQENIESEEILHIPQDFTDKIKNDN